MLHQLQIPFTVSLVSLRAQLVRMRHASGLTQKQLAQAAGVSKRSIAAYESGEAQPSLDLLVRVADALGVTLDQIIGRTVRAPRVLVDDVLYAPAEQVNELGAGIADPAAVARAVRARAEDLAEEERVAQLEEAQAPPDHEQDDHDAPEDGE